MNDSGLSLQQFTDMMTEMQEQPAWRARADREADYCDGNQLNSEVLNKMRWIGLPPAIEPLIGPTIDAVLGAEAKSRTDWRVLPAGRKAADDVAEAMNEKLNEAERQSHADDACSAAYAGEIKVGLHWVEVARESDPFKYPYRCEDVHRNEIWWDFLAKKADISDARYLVRRKWTDVDRAALMFPDKAGLIRSAGNGWAGIDIGTLTTDGGTSTDLAMSWTMERGWSIEEQEWRDTVRRRVCLFEVWYRTWERILVLKMPDGRVVEYDRNNPKHTMAIAIGGVKPQHAIVARVHLSWWIGPHKLSDEPSPYKHKHFPYVPFWGKREDRTRVPYGLVRGMMYLQDEVNARISKMQWGLSAVRTTRTKGAVMSTDERFRQEVARVDADIVLDPEAMANGGVFKVDRDFLLNEQQFKRLEDAREGIKRAGGIYSSYLGEAGQHESGVAFAGMVEQSDKTLADINDNYAMARRQVGNLLLALVIEDMIGQHEVVTIDGKGIRDDREIPLNVPMVDEETGIRYLDNDIERAQLMVDLSDVPSTPSFRTQQLAVMSEAFKAAPPAYQRVLMPYLFALMDVPDRMDMLKAIREADQSPSPEQIQQMIDDAVEQALTKAQIGLKNRELDQKQPLIDAQVKKTIYEAVSTAVESMFSATQAGANIAVQPEVAPLADAMLKSGGFLDQNEAPIVPNVPAGVDSVAPEARPNTSPNFPDRVSSPDEGAMAGIEGG